MSGICSAHQGEIPVDGCSPCSVTPADIFPDCDEKLVEAAAAGTHECRSCGFVYYKTVDTCPKCNIEREGW